jgi:ATP-dependent DNA helicase RecG
MEITLEYIQQIASSHEGVDVEFKETTGQLNRGMETLCGMMNGNGGIANVMFISGLIEHWGRGLSLMDNECKRVELPVPQIYDDGFMVRVSFDRKSQAGSQAECQGGQAEGQAETELNLSNSVLKLIDTLGEDFLSTKEILKDLGLSSRSSFRDNYIIPAMKLELIKLENPAKPSSPNQRYGLTVKGKSIYYRDNN